MTRNLTPASKRLAPADIEAAAKLLRVEPAAIYAVSVVEAPRGGFLPDGRPTILFEAHKFHKYAGGRFDKSHPHLSSRAWNKKLYRKTTAGEWERLNEAMMLDWEAGVMSASWGAYQICGFNYKLCGFATVLAFHDAMHRNEGAHLLALCEYLTRTGLVGALRRHDWQRFAAGYNGAEYWRNNYDSKLARAYQNALKLDFWPVSGERSAGRDRCEPPEEAENSATPPETPADGPAEANTPTPEEPAADEAAATSFLDEAADTASPQLLREQGKSAAGRLALTVGRPMALFFAALQAGNLYAWLGVAALIAGVAALVYWHRADLRRLGGKVWRKLTSGG